MCSFVSHNIINASKSQILWWNYCLFLKGYHNSCVSVEFFVARFQGLCQPFCALGEIVSIKQNFLHFWEHNGAYDNFEPNGGKKFSRVVKRIIYSPNEDSMTGWNTVLLNLKLIWMGYNIEIWMWYNCIRLPVTCLEECVDQQPGCFIILSKST